jgi:hypothetical protein
MLSGTFLAVLLIPLLYVLVVRVFERKKARAAVPAPEAPLPAEGKP